MPTQLTANNTLLASPLPEWLSRPAVQRIEGLGFFQGSPHGINHCLINEYLPGQGIMPHEDGPAYHPVVATVSLGGTLVLDISRKKSTNGLDETVESEKEQASEMRSFDRQKSWRIVQEPRSLLVTTEPTYSNTLHGIAEIEADLDLRAETVANWGILANQDAIEVAGARNQRETRISLTFRDVLRVSSLSSRVLGRART